MVFTLHWRSLFNKYFISRNLSDVSAEKRFNQSLGLLLVTKNKINPWIKTLPNWSLTGVLQNKVGRNSSHRNLKPFQNFNFTLKYQNNQIRFHLTGMSFGFGKQTKVRIFSQNRNARMIKNVKKKVASAPLAASNLNTNVFETKTKWTWMWSNLINSTSAPRDLLHIPQHASGTLNQSF